MAHIEQMNFISYVKENFPNYFNLVKVLDVGSLDINGNNRGFFENYAYVGIDVSPGENVDVVCQGQHYNAQDGTFDTVLSTECFEHNPYWIGTFANMIRMCKQNGLIIFTCATIGRPEHGTSRSAPDDSPLTVGLGWDYYKNLDENDFRNVFNFDALFTSYEFKTNACPADIYFWGIKK